MKQNITVEQLQELSDKGKERLRKTFPLSYGDWFAINEEVYLYCKDTLLEASYVEGRDSSVPYPLLSFGQMIEFLDDDSVDHWHDLVGATSADKLCDALWGAVREVLEENV